MLTYFYAKPEAAGSGASLTVVQAVSPFEEASGVVISGVDLAEMATNCGMTSHLLLSGGEKFPLGGGSKVRETTGCLLMEHPSRAGGVAPPASCPPDKKFKRASSLHTVAPTVQPFGGASGFNSSSSSSARLPPAMLPGVFFDPNLVLVCRQALAISALNKAGRAGDGGQRVTSNPCSAAGSRSQSAITSLLDSTVTSPTRPGSQTVGSCSLLR